MSSKAIKSIKIKGLYGLYDYTLTNTSDLTSVSILYGDNGVGKSTILRLVFHLLSAANNRGHRGALLGADFKKISVELESDVEISAEHIESQTKTIQLEIKRGLQKLVIWEYSGKSNSKESDSFNSEFYFEIDADGKRILRRRLKKALKEDEKIPRGEVAFLAQLSEHAPSLYILNAERKLDSDSVPDPSDEVELRRHMRYEEPKKISDLITRSREIALSQALSSAAKWIGQKAVVGANRGSMNVHSVYINILNHFAAPKAEKTSSSIEVLPALLQQLNEIEQKTADHAKYELATTLSTQEFKKALGRKLTKKSQLVADLLNPYLRSLEGRLNAVDPIYLNIDRFVKTINSLLKDKIISFKLSQGFKITNSMGVNLSPAQLSSGEQQLLLLFCYVLTSRDSSSVFMIDEPEISLNIKWQRQLIQSLVSITEGAEIQFIFASHSMELLAQHRNCVIKMENQK